MFRYILLCCLLIGGLLSPATAQTNKKIRSLQREQSSLKKDIANQEQLLKSTKKDVNTQLANLQVLGAQIEGQQKYVNGIHTEIKTLSSDINQLEKQLAALERDLTDCKRKYQRAVTYMFRNRMRFSQWQFILSAHSFRQMYRRMRYVTEFSRYQQAQGRVIQKKEAVIEAKRQQLLSAKAEKDRLYTEGKEQTAKLEGQQKERQQVVDELNKKQKQLNASLNKQRKKYAQLNARIDKLIQEEIAAAERRRKAEAERRRKAELARQRKLRQQREQAAADVNKQLLRLKTSLRARARTITMPRKRLHLTLRLPTTLTVPSRGVLPPTEVDCRCPSQDRMPSQHILDNTMCQACVVYSLTTRVSTSQVVRGLRLAPCSEAR